ncbi:hypothetical protein TNCV_1379501 [Trichonephila clavipes]|nr:hypothetical protein TNCV_1379501 [Trichonephila clavipes]
MKTCDISVTLDTVTSDGDDEEYNSNYNSSTKIDSDLDEKDVDSLENSLEEREFSSNIKRVLREISSMKLPENMGNSKDVTSPLEA